MMGIYFEIRPVSTALRSRNDCIFMIVIGNESFAVVEFAPCQKVPAEKKKADPRIGTIEQGLY